MPEVTRKEKVWKTSPGERTFYTYLTGWLGEEKQLDGWELELLDNFLAYNPYLRDCFQLVWRSKRNGTSFLPYVKETCCLACKPASITWLPKVPLYFEKDSLPVFFEKRESFPIDSL